MRNPKWHRDEIILALDLYFSESRGSIDSSNKRVIALSKILNDLPLFTNRPDKERFRNVNGVSLKLANFVYFDSGKGMSRGSKLDKQIFQEFYDRRLQLRKIAAQIRKVAETPELREKVIQIEEDEVSETDSVIEGQILYKMHKVRERSPIIIFKKKEQAWAKFGKLACEVCVFDFENYYGEIGKKYIECHHRTPLANFNVSTKTGLDDLALVCSNCHRMLHKRIDTITVEELRTMIKYDRI